jgi:hypothetical protein
MLYANERLLSPICLSVCDCVSSRAGRSRLISHKARADGWASAELPRREEIIRAMTGKTHVRYVPSLRACWQQPRERGIVRHQHGPHTLPCNILSTEVKVVEKVITNRPNTSPFRFNPVTALHKPKCLRESECPAAASAAKSTTAPNPPVVRRPSAGSTRTLPSPKATSCTPKPSPSSSSSTVRPPPCSNPPSPSFQD